MAKKALIIGIFSQDGSYLADLLLEKNYEVIGTLRRSTTYIHENVKHLYGKVNLEFADLLDYESMARLVRKYKPDEVYNIASQSVPADSWDMPFYTAEISGIGPMRILEVVRHFHPEARVYQATTREVFGNIEADAATEKKLFDANNPYGIAKAYAHMMTRCYRESYDMFSCSGILFNHESPRRGLWFVTRKVTAAVACIKNNVKNPPINEFGEPLISPKGKLHMGDLTTTQDWGYAKEYVEAMWLMLQQDKPQDYIIGTNRVDKVEDLCRLAFAHAGLDYKDYVISDQRFFRPTEIKSLKGDYAKAKKDLGWEPKTSFEDLITLMVDSDLETFT